MILWEAIIEEIALEGLDGITLPTLWFRLQSRPGFDFVLDDPGKQWIWDYIRHRGNIFSFYQLPGPRRSLDFGGDDDASLDTYSVRIISEGQQWGSCSTFDSRVDITGEIIGDAYASLDVAIEAFGSESFVVVATQSERTRALLGSKMDLGTVFRDSMSSRQHYAMLERIGRSRYKGVSASREDSLHSLFNMRAKDTFYVIKLLESFGIITKQLVSTHNGTTALNACNVSLSRFSTPLDRSKYLAPFRQLVTLLESKEDKRASFIEVKALFGIPTVLPLKKMLFSFPGIVTTMETTVRVSEESISSPKKKKKRKRKRQEAEEDDGQGEEQEDDQATAKERYFCLTGKLNIDEDTGEIVAPKIRRDEETEMEMEGEENGTNDGDGAVSMDWTRHNPFRTRVFETLRTIRQAGSDGIDAREMTSEIACTRKQVERLMMNLKDGPWLKSVVENEGSQRRTKYLWSSAEHQAEQYYRRFEELTYLRFDDFDEREKLLMSERTVRRMIFILERIEDIPVSIMFENLKALRAHEHSEGYNHAIDKKCFETLLKFLSTRGQVKTFITILKEGSLQRTVEFLCHKRIQLSSPEIQAKMAEVREQMALQQERQAEEDEWKEVANQISDGSPMKKPRKRRFKKLAGEETLSAPLTKWLKISDVGPAPCKKAWRRIHPAVQQQLNGRRTGHLALKRKRKWSELDENDRASIEKRKRVRSQFSWRERQMLLLMRAVSYVFYPGSRLWVESSLVRDLMHKYLPESLDKTTKTLVQCSTRDLGTNPKLGETMLFMAEQLKKHKAIKMIKKQLCGLENTPEGKRWAFTEAFEIARKMFYGCAEQITFDDLDLSTVYETYDVSADFIWKSLWRSEDVRVSEDIVKNTAKRSIYSAVSLSRRDGSFVAHLNKIFGSIPANLLFAAVAKLRQDGLVISRKRSNRLRGKPMAEEDVRRHSGGDLLLSFFYRHFFYHPFHINLHSEANSLMETLSSHRDEWHNVLSKHTGNIPALIALTWDKQIFFDLTVPSNIVNYSETDDNQANPDAEGNDPDDDCPVIIFSSIDWHHEDLDEDDAGFTPVPPRETQLTANGLPEVKTETPETGAVRLSCLAANKWLLYQLRQERLHACEHSDSRSISVRIRDLRLNSCTLTAKLNSSYKNNSSTEKATVRLALNKLMAATVVKEKEKTPETVVSDKKKATGTVVSNKKKATGTVVNDKKKATGTVVSDKNKATRTVVNDKEKTTRTVGSSKKKTQSREISSDKKRERILRLLEEKGPIGMTSEEVQEALGGGDDAMKDLKDLVLSDNIFTCGVAKKRYVHSEHVKPWTVTSFRIPKDERSREQQDAATSSRPDQRGESVRFMPRQWLKPDGTLNKPALRWLCEGVLLRIMSMPGVTDSNIYEQFASVLDPIEANELIEFLVNIGCLSKMEKECTRKIPRLFDPPKVERLPVTCYFVTLDALTKFAVAFDNTPMPDFVTMLGEKENFSSSSGVFGRRRLPITPYPPASSK